MPPKSRRKRADLLLLEVKRSLEDPTEDELQQELRELRLETLCGPGRKRSE